MWPETKALCVLYAEIMRLSGKKVLVTGAGQGIGQAIALRLAEEGADVAIDYPRDQDRGAAQETSGRIEKLGRRAPLIEADVSKAADAQRMVSASVEALGGLDILVNNAGIERRAPFVDVPEHDH